MKKQISVIGLLLILFACKKEQPIQPTPIDRPLIVTYKVTGGNDMLVVYWKKWCGGNTDSMLFMHSPYTFETSFKTNIGDTLAIHGGSNDTTVAIITIDNIKVASQKLLPSQDIDLYYIVK